MLTYAEAAAKLGTKASKKLENNTHLVRYSPDAIGVKLHQTTVVLIMSDGRYELRTGGWQTVTTKDRINNYSPVRISQVKGKWWVADGEPFVEGMVVVG